jgi:hypothetical protein
VLKNAILPYQTGTCKGNQAVPDEPEMIQERRGMQSVVRRYMHLPVARFVNKAML